MKVFISADIEGVTTTSDWQETFASEACYKEHALQMTKEVLAACEGAINAGAKEIFVKDAHGSARNIIQNMLPDCVKIHRKWSGHPYGMVDGIDSTFDAVMFIGYHSAAYQSTNPLAHTMNTKNSYITINDSIASEFTLHSYAAAIEKVPTIFLSGDKGLCEYSLSSNPSHPKLVTVSVKEGKGEATINYSPNLMIKTIKEKAEFSLKQDLKNALIKLPNYFKVEVSYKEHIMAEKNQYFPNVDRKDEHTLTFERDNFFDVLRTLKFIL